MGIQWVKNQTISGEKNAAAESLLNEKNAESVLAFHRQIPQYAPTPLRSLSALAGRLELGAVYVKDESFRMGLNSFKVLGGVYAIGRCIAQKLQTDLGSLTLEDLKAEHTRGKIGALTFATATDGNHGRGIAWAAHMLGYPSVVYMPAGSSLERMANIRAFGAETTITDRNYDDTVAMVFAKAEQKHWTVLQDTTMDGYDEVPSWIIQGYATMALEITRQLREMALEPPTHLFLQAGVGAFAASAAGFFLANAGEMPSVTVVEPDQADCYYRSFAAQHLTPVGGAMETIMCGLACGVPNRIGWDILHHCTSCSVSVPDEVSAHGMRVYGNPLEGDSRVVSGESGAVTMGLLSMAMQLEELRPLRETLGLNAASRVLLISTEGATDETVYRDVVWNGRYANA